MVAVVVRGEILGEFLALWKARLDWGDLMVCLVFAKRLVLVWRLV